MNRKSREKINQLGERKADVLRMMVKWSCKMDPKEVLGSHVVQGTHFEICCPVAPPLEEFMGFPPDSSRKVRLKRFFTDIRVGDVVYGTVFTKMLSGIVIKLLACEPLKMARSVDDLEIKAVCPTEHMPTVHVRQDPVDSYEIKDILRTVVVNVNSEQEKVVVSLSRKDLSDDRPAISLGLITHDELPKYYSKIIHEPPAASDDFASYIRRQREFDNPAFLDTMRQHLKVPHKVTSGSWYSLLPGYCGKQISPEEMAKELTEVQSSRWSMQSVEEGIKLMKEGETTAALGCLNKAVEMNKNNVEAIVARGALFAKKEDYHRAIKDFEEAIKQKPSHRNARKYLADTFFALGKKFEKDEPDRAIKCYKDALRWDSRFEQAQQARENLLNRDQKPDSTLSSSKSSGKPLSSTAEKLRQMLHTSEKSSASKRVKRSRSGSNSSSSDDDDRSRRRGRSRSSSYKNGRRRRISRTISLDTGNRQQSKECRHWSNTSNRVRNESRDNAYDRRKKTPEVAVVEVDVDDLEAQLEKFKRDKKAQALANNKDVFKRTFL